MFTVTVVRKLRVNLKYPNVAIDEFGNRGQWTMIYNEGFEVMINQRIFFGYSYFTKVIKGYTVLLDVNAM
jgi:cathepsin C